jgi:hypothetical protein
MKRTTFARDRGKAAPAPGASGKLPAVMPAIKGFTVTESGNATLKQQSMYGLAAVSAGCVPLQGGKCRLGAGKLSRKDFFFYFVGFIDRPTAR